MCGRYYFDIDEKEFKEIIDEVEKNLYAEYKTGEIYPSNVAPIYVKEEEKMKPILAKWGLPRWDNKGLIINARVETLEEKRTFKTLLEKRRCIVPASAYFEWEKRDPISKLKYKHKIKKPNSVLYFAGLYNVIKNESSKQMSLFDNNHLGIYYTIITKKADESVNHIHDRMPVIFEYDEISDWLRGKNINDMLKDNMNLTSELRIL